MQELSWSILLNGFSNKTLFQIHSWIGLNFGLLLFLICFSGTVATISYEIDWLLNSPQRIGFHEGETKLDWGTLIETVRKDAPAEIVGAIMEPRHPGFATSVFTGTSLADFRVYCINPYTGEITGQVSSFSLQRFFRTFHKQFFIIDTPVSVNGVFIVGLWGIFLFFAAVSGILFYKNFLQRLFTLRFTKGIRTLTSDVHRLLGVWSIVFALIFAVTGMWYALEVALRWLDVDVAHAHYHIDEDELASYGPHVSMLPINDLYAIAQEAIPELDISLYRIPFQIDEPIVFYGQSDAVLVRDSANAVSLNPFTGEVMDKHTGADMGLIERWVHTADPLHFGTWGGIVTQILYFVFGLAISISVLTGVYIYFIRMNNLSASSTGKRSLWGWVWTIVSFSITFIILLQAAIFTVVSLYTVGSTVGSRAVKEYVIHGTKDVGPWEVTLKSLAGRADATTKTFTMLCGSFERMANFNKAWLHVGDDKTKFPLTGNGTFNLTSKVVLPETDQETTPLLLTIESWDGEKHTGVFPLLVSSDHERIEKVSGSTYPIPATVWAFIVVYLATNVVIIIGWFRYIQWRV